MKPAAAAARARQHGVVLLLLLAVLGLGAASLFLSGAGRVDTRAAPERRTSVALKEARDALLGFAVANGRLPRPARDPATGREADALCTSEQSCTGLLPWTTLGIAAGDGWGRLLRYSVTPALTISPIDPAQAGGSKSVLTRQRERLVYLAGSAECARATPGLAPSAVPPGAPGGAAAGTPAGAPTIGPAAVAANGAAATAPAIPCPAAIILSSGRDNYGISLAGIPQRGRTSGNRDERANALSSTVFMMRARSEPNHPGGEFDDQLVWITPDALLKTMQRARVLARTE